MKSTPTKRPRGRPTKCSPELVDEIVQRISLGETLAQICRDHNIDRSTVYDWRNADEDFSLRFAKARQDGFDAISEETIRIADTVPAISEEVAKARLRVETRLKLLAKWDPRRYGERVQNEISGPEGGPVAVNVVQRTLVDPAKGSGA